MRSISAARRLVGHASDTTWYRVARSPDARRRAVPQTGGRRSRAPLADGVVVQEDEVVLLPTPGRNETRRLCFGLLPQRPSQAWHLAPHGSSGWPRVQPHARAVADRRGDSFVSLLGAGRATLPVWEGAGSGGDLAGAHPRLGRRAQRAQRNPVHRFTVDRHLVETAIQAAKYQRDVDRPTCSWWVPCCTTSARVVPVPTTPTSGSN